MRVRKLSETGDMTFGGGTLCYYIDTPATVGQVVETSLKLWLGEWFLDTTLGVPYLQGILGKHSKDIADTTIKEQILQCQGVVNIAEYSSVIDADHQAMSVTCTINTLYGVTQVQLQNYLYY